MCHTAKVLKHNSVLHFYAAKSTNNSVLLEGLQGSAGNVVMEAHRDDTEQKLG